jgi:rubredoxin
VSPRLPVASDTADDIGRGVCCPKCQARARVVDIDRKPGVNWRRHECQRCGWRFSSEERIVAGRPGVESAV